MQTIDSHSKAVLMRPVVAVLASSASSALCVADFSFEFRLSGQIDAAVTYPSLNGYPYNAIFGEFAGSLQLGDEVAIAASVTVDNTHQFTINNFEGSVDVWTFGSSTPLGWSGVVLWHDRPFLLPGAFSEPLDTIALEWGDLRDGPGGPVPIATRITLFAESGTLVSPDRQLIPTTFDDFVAAIDGAVLWINTPNSFLTGAFVTDPSYTIVPAPGVLLTLAGALAARRRRPASAPSVPA